MWRVVPAVLVALAASCAPAAAQRLAPGLYGGRPPVGQVSANNELLRPQGWSRGVVMTVHGGAWLMVGKHQMTTARTGWFTRHGYTVYNVDYRPGRDSLVDVVAAYDHLRRLMPAARICAYGESAGGTLAALLAASRPSVACLITEAGIEDLRSWATSCGTPICKSATFGAAAFAGSELWEFSPLRLMKKIRMPWLAAGSTADRVVNEREQLGELRVVSSPADVMLLRGVANATDPNFTHASVTGLSLRRFHRAELKLLRESYVGADDPSPAQRTLKPRR